jgi:ribose 5-phosphate isomerase A
MIPTSIEVAMACSAMGLKTTSLLSARPNWIFDGADEVDRAGNFIKGRGGALFQEKLMFAASREIYVLVDRSKLVDKLGTKFPVPVETSPLAMRLVEQALLDLGAHDVKLRLAAGKDGPVITENNNIILDAFFADIEPTLEAAIKRIVGVIESGLFTGYQAQIVVAGETDKVPAPQIGARPGA